MSKESARKKRKRKEKRRAEAELTFPDRPVIPKRDAVFDDEEPDEVVREIDKAKGED